MDDLISRETVREALQMYVPGFKWDTIDKIVDMMPSAQPEVQSDGTLVIDTDKYSDVKRVLVQNGTDGTLYYADAEPQWIPCSDCERRCDKWEHSKTSQE